MVFFQPEHEVIYFVTFLNKSRKDHGCDLFKRAIMKVVYFMNNI